MTIENSIAGDRTSTHDLTADLARGAAFGNCAGSGRATGALVWIAGMSLRFDRWDSGFPRLLDTCAWAPGKGTTILRRRAMASIRAHRSLCLGALTWQQSPAVSVTLSVLVCESNVRLRAEVALRARMFVPNRSPAAYFLATLLHSSNGDRSLTCSAAAGRSSDVSYLGRSTAHRRAFKIQPVCRQFSGRANRRQSARLGIPTRHYRLAGRFFRPSGGVH